MAVQDQLKGMNFKQEKPKTPVWKGPGIDGITYSLLSRFLVCRERFRLHVMEGLQPQPTFNHKLEYGNMWHAAEEGAHLGKYPIEALDRYCLKLLDRFPYARNEILHWCRVCKIQFPIYQSYWGVSSSILDAKTDSSPEEVFSIRYHLDSSTSVLLRGKFDAVIKVREQDGTEVLWLKENKCKGQIKDHQIQRQLTFDLQTMLYLTALQTREESKPPWDRLPIRGVIYNVIRRPLSGGKGTIVRHKPTKSNPQGESEESFYNRVGQYIQDEPGEYFKRWQVAVSKEDIDRFRKECLDPILRQLIYWYRHISMARKTNESLFGGLHWRHPFGVYNVLDEGGSSDLDEYLISGGEAGLIRTDNLFPELEG